MGQTGRHAAGGQVRAALAGPRFCGRTGTAVPVLWARGCPLAPFPLVPINIPWGSQEGDTQKVVQFSFHVIV